MKKFLFVIFILSVSWVYASADDNNVEYNSRVFSFNHSYSSKDEYRDFYLQQQLDTVTGATKTYLCYLDILPEGYKNNRDHYNRYPKALLKVKNNVYELSSADWNNPGTFYLCKAYRRNSNYDEWYGFVVIFPLSDELIAEISKYGIEKLRYESSGDLYDNINIPKPKAFAKRFKEALKELDEKRAAHNYTTQYIFKDRTVRLENPLYQNF